MTSQGSFSCLAGALSLGWLALGCRSHEPISAPASREALPLPAVAIPAAAPSGAVSSSASVRNIRLDQIGASALFLVGVQGETVSVRSLDSQTRVLVPQVSSWLYDPEHGLLWTREEDRLWVRDLRQEVPPVQVAKCIPEVGSIWVEWPSNSGSQFVRPETGCDESVDAVEVKIRPKPSLRLVENNVRRPILPSARRWLEAQTKRTVSRRLTVNELESGAERVALPDKWTGCEGERCGLSVAFGRSALRLVLVKEDMGADCAHRSCLLFDSVTQRFASPPVLADEQATLSLSAHPPRWTSADQALPGVCGPYLFDAKGTAFLIRSYLCQLDAACEPLGGEGIGWLEPGVVVGGPG